mgnify:CR=1 FL=1
MAGSRFFRGGTPAYPEQALERDLKLVQDRRSAFRRDTTPPERRLADNMLDYNPAATESLVQLMWGALLPGREGGLLNARLRYFDPERRRAGVPQDVAALVSELSDTRTVVTLVNLNASAASNGRRAGRRLRRASTGQRDQPAAATTAIDAPIAHGAARARVWTKARPGDEALRQRSDRRASMGSPAATPDDARAAIASPDVERRARRVRRDKRAWLFGVSRLTHRQPPPRERLQLDRVLVASIVTAPSRSVRSTSAPTAA